MRRIVNHEMWSYGDFVLTSGQVAERGHLACAELATGQIVVGTADSTLYAIGMFDEDLTGDGTKTVRVKLFREVVLHAFANDSVAPVAADDLFNTCFIKDSSTVSMDGTGRSAAGRIWKATATSVLVEMAR